MKLSVRCKTFCGVSEKSSWRVNYYLRDVLVDLRDGRERVRHPSNGGGFIGGVFQAIKKKERSRLLSSEDWSSGDTSNFHSCRQGSTRDYCLPPPS